MRKKQKKLQRELTELDDVIQTIEGSSTQPAKRGMTHTQAREQSTQLRKPSTPHEVKQVPYTEQQMLEVWASAQEQQRMSIAASQYVNVEEKLENTSWFPSTPDRYVRFQQFDGSQEQVQLMVDLFSAELCEPYSSFTYQHFIFGWPDLAILAFGVQSSSPPKDTDRGSMVGAAVSSVARAGPNQPLKGYIAMLAVSPSFRGSKIGSKLVIETVNLMKRKECDVVGLETPLGQAAALKLYLSLGFTKTKFFHRYYVDGSDAFRLKLWLKPSPLAVVSAYQTAQVQDVQTKDAA